MRRLFFAWAALVSTGCSGLLGLDEFSEGEASSSTGDGGAPTTSSGDPTTTTSGDTTTTTTTTTGPGGGDGGAGPGPSGPGGGGDGGAGGNGGAGGEEPIDCPPNRADCDGDNIDCETNLLDNQQACGACDAPCDGLCQGLSCTAFEVLDQGIYGSAWGGIAFSSTDVYWVGSTDPNGNTYFVNKADKATLTKTNLASNLERLTWIQAGSQRLFFGSYGGPYVIDSMLFNGTDYRREVDYGVYGVFSNNVLHYAQNYNGATYLQWENVLSATMGTTWQITANSNPPWDGHGIAPGFLADSGYLTYAVSRFDSGSQTSSYAIFETYYQGSTPNQVIALQPGRPGRMRTSFGDLYWIEIPDGGGPQVLKTWDGTAGSEVRTLTSATYIQDFVVDGFFIAVAFYDDATQTRGIRLINDSSQQSVDLFPNLAPTSMELDGDYVYFFEGSSQRLLRILRPIPN